MVKSWSFKQTCFPRRKKEQKIKTTSKVEILTLLLEHIGLLAKDIKV